MLTKYIETVKSQIKFFDYKINKSRNNTRMQAIYWPLKYKFEQLLNYLEKHPQDEQSKNKISLEKTGVRQKGKRTERKNTLELEKNILEVINNHNDGLHVKDIYKVIAEAKPNISYSKIVNRISEMYNKKGILEWVAKGVYKIK